MIYLSTGFLSELGKKNSVNKLKNVGRLVLLLCDVVDRHEERIKDGALQEWQKRIEFGEVDIPLERIAVMWGESNSYTIQLLDKYVKMGIFEKKDIQRYHIFNGVKKRKYQDHIYNPRQSFKYVIKDFHQYLYGDQQEKNYGDKNA